MTERFPGENLEIAHQMFVWWNLGGHDLELAADAVHPDVEFRTPLTSTSGDVYRGMPGLRAWMAEIDDQFEEWYSLPNDWVPLEDGRVLVLGDLHMRGRQSGVELDQSLGWLLTFRDGRLLRYEVFADQDEARHAAGLAGASG